MSGIRFPTREIGSLAKPSWRVKAFAGRPLEEQDLAEAERWGQRLEVEGHEQPRRVAPLRGARPRRDRRLGGALCASVCSSGRGWTSSTTASSGAPRCTTTSLRSRTVSRSAGPFAPSTTSTTRRRRSSRHLPRTARRTSRSTGSSATHTDREVKVPLTGRVHDGRLVVRRALRARGRSRQLGRAALRGAAALRARRGGARDQAECSRSRGSGLRLDPDRRAGRGRPSPRRCRWSCSGSTPL